MNTTQDSEKWVVKLPRDAVEHLSDANRAILENIFSGIASSCVKEGRLRKITLKISGYNSDPRELYEIPEVCAWARDAFKFLPSLWFFLDDSSRDRFVGWLCGPVSRRDVESSAFLQRFNNKLKECTSISISSTSDFLERAGADNALISAFYFQEIQKRHDMRSGSGQEKITRKTATSHEIVEVPDPWGMGGKGPFILEKNPDIPAILSARNPRPPKSEEQWNNSPSIVMGGSSAENTRGYLAMAYMRHPDAEVRAATIRFVGSHPRKELMVGLVLAQRLTVDREDVQRVAAEAIWKRGHDELQETMNYLAGNDESPGDDGNGATVHREQIRIALQILYNANPSHENEFRDALLYGWCWHDDRLAGLARRLIEVWFARKTFLDEQSKKVARGVGTDLHSLGGLDVMRLMFRPVTLLVGSTAAAELNHAWSGIGGWLP